MISTVAQRQKINPVARLPVDWIAKERKTRRCVTKVDSDATKRRVKSGQVATSGQPAESISSPVGQPVASYSVPSRRLQCFCMSSRRKTRRRKNQLLVAILAFCGILRNQSTSAKIQTLAREFQQFLHETQTSRRKSRFLLTNFGSRLQFSSSSTVRAPLVQIVLSHSNSA
ncbi:hypothetical protein F511_14700 [Dorcoceras hygrometricum]|uniref:Uncharacterized protein n=1 Tax=Dorcoceras hygrometricum TaxID=472368 RepID=A0A2Z7AS72_9LAMI|nr:hypothetical protein F511_14700 [Dorcoceras hygrometricum]